MRFYLDCEFEERGYEYPIHLISIAVVCDNGEFYAQVDDERNVFIMDGVIGGFTTEEIARVTQVDPWLVDNVYRNLSLNYLRPEQWVTRSELRTYLTDWLKVMQSTDKTMEFWGYFADYDWVLFSQIFGRMIDLQTVIPQLPMLCMDLKQEMIRLEIDKKAMKQEIDLWTPINRNYMGQTLTEHHCLYDARWNKAAYNFIRNQIELTM